MVRGASVVPTVRRQLPALQGALYEDTVRSSAFARAAGRRRLEQDVGRTLHAAAATSVSDDAAAAIISASLTAAWGTAALRSVASGGEMAAELAAIIDAFDPRLRRAAATEAARAFNDERALLMSDLGGSGQGPPEPPSPAPGGGGGSRLFKIWSAILDGRTCAQCFAADGEVVELHESFRYGNPPLHPHCRCIVEHIAVARPERLEDIAIDYEAFKEELRDVIREQHVSSERHARGFLDESMGDQRSPHALTRRGTRFVRDGLLGI